MKRTLNNNFFARSNAEQTEVERVFIQKLIRQLKAKGLNCEVHWAVLISHQGKDCYPDIYIPSLLLAIEIDGEGHDAKVEMRGQDIGREDFYFELGINMTRITNDDVLREGFINRHITDLLDWSSANPRSKADVDKVKSRVKRGRHEFVCRMLFPGVPPLTVERDAAFIQFRKGQLFGGLKFIVSNRKRKSGPK